jgi:hypothetical protein
MQDCCKLKSYSAKKCIRKDKKVFDLPRKFSIKKCKGEIKGFTMRSSCAPFKMCKKQKGGTKKQFLFNPKNPKKSFDVYIDKNPNDTIKIKYTTINDVKNTIKNLERLYKKGKYSHKRIWQVGMILNTRLKVLYKYRKTRYKKAKNIPQRFRLANRYFKFLGKRTKVKNIKTRKRMNFKIE